MGSQMSLLILSPEFFSITRPFSPQGHIYVFLTWLRLSSISGAAILRGSYTFPGPLLGKASCHSLLIKACLNGALIRLFSICIGCIMQSSLGHNVSSRRADPVWLPK